MRLIELLCLMPYVYHHSNYRVHAGFLLGNFQWDIDILKCLNIEAIETE